MTFYLVRNPRISFKEFVRYHTTEVVPLFKSLRIVRENVLCYTVSHTITTIIPCMPPRRYDGIVELYFKDLNAAIEVFTNSEYLEKMRTKEEHFLNLMACEYIISNEYPPIIKRYVYDAAQKESKIKFTTLLIRNPKMTFEEFAKHHREKHIQLFSSVPIIQKNVLRYVVSHSISAFIPGFRPQKYDGIVEFWFDDFISMISIFINPEYLSKVRPDEKRFLDLKACDFIISRELPPIIG